MQVKEVSEWVKIVTKDVVSEFDTIIWGLGFTRSKADHCVYFKLIGDRVIYLVLYVDDMLLVGNDKEIIQDLNI